MFGTRRLSTIAITALFGVLIAIPVVVLANPGLTVTDLAHGVTATQLANSLVGGGVTITNVTYTGANNAAGSFSGGAGIVGFDSGIVLGSGSVQSVGTAPCSADGTNAKGVEGPNACQGVTTSNATAGDADLTTLAGFDTFDAAILEFDFVPKSDTVSFRYVFSSDEYNEYSNSSYNDVFGFFVNQTNCALVPGTTEPVSINTINGGNPLGTDPKHPEYYRNNDFQDGTE
ncbi:MAG: choice-of-anchor L domain-containing protein, partial [Candidatus Limnocylindria bacterium]